ncbi:hypothetical protein TNCV_460261 [Trichonephila clavipes]|nr:hypothetical protein TNCV_460261 [Trichonephila clavipes]
MKRDIDPEAAWNDFPESVIQAQFIKIPKRDLDAIGSRIIALYSPKIAYTLGHISLLLRCTIRKNNIQHKKKKNGEIDNVIEEVVGSQFRSGCGDDVHVFPQSGADD